MQNKSTQSKTVVKKSTTEAELLGRDPKVFLPKISSKTMIEMHKAVCTSNLRVLRIYLHWSECGSGSGSLLVLTKSLHLFNT